MGLGEQAGLRERVAAAGQPTWDREIWCSGFPFLPALPAAGRLPGWVAGGLGECRPACGAARSVSALCLSLSALPAGRLVPFYILVWSDLPAGLYLLSARLLARLSVCPPVWPIGWVSAFLFVPL
jgi:hypothetical protein